MSIGYKDGITWKDVKEEIEIQLMEYPTEKDWTEVKRRAFVTIGKETFKPPTKEWKKAILNARHSPIRYLRFSFLLKNIPSYVSVHLVRHVHAQPYVKSQRNDRQNDYDRNKAPQDAPVNMIWDINGEEMMVIANKRLCNLADPKTQEIVQIMCNEIIKRCPEFKDFLVPMCKYNGKCHEIKPCNKIINKK